MTPERRGVGGTFRAPMPPKRSTRRQGRSRSAARLAGVRPIMPSRRRSSPPHASVVDQLSLSRSRTSWSERSLAQLDRRSRGVLLERSPSSSAYPVRIGDGGPEHPHKMERGAREGCTQWCTDHLGGGHPPCPGLRSYIEASLL